MSTFDLSFSLSIKKLLSVPYRNRTWWPIFVSTFCFGQRSDNATIRNVTATILIYLELVKKKRKIKERKNVKKWILFSCLTSRKKIERKRNFLIRRLLQSLLLLIFRVFLLGVLFYLEEIFQSLLLTEYFIFFFLQMGTKHL